MLVERKRLKVVHYLNQFFGKEGGEDRAHIPFQIKEGPVGAGMALQKILGERGDVVATLICGDNYFAQNVEKASREGIELILPYKPDIFIAGPAFEAGRYGVACGAICKSAHEKLGIPAITGMFSFHKPAGRELVRQLSARTTPRRRDSLTLITPEWSRSARSGRSRTARIEIREFSPFWADAGRGWRGAII